MTMLHLLLLLLLLPFFASVVVVVVVVFLLICIAGGQKVKKNCMYGKFAEHVNFFLAFETGLAWNDFSLCCRVFCCWLFIFVKFFLDFCLAAAACKNIYWHVCASFATAVLVVCCFHCFASCSFLEFQLLFRENGVTRAVRVAPS